MRHSSFFGPVRWLAVLLLLCASAAAAQTTTFTGTVYSPKGVPVGSGTANTGGDPIPNILVFAVDPNYPPPVFSQGQVLPTGSQSGCSAQPSLVPNAVLGSALTDFKGNFTFNTSGNVPNPVTVVIQAGKWRRQYQFDTSVVTQGATNTLPPLVMPSAQGAGVDLPHIAISTGDVDALECIFHQIGIADSEVTGPGGGGSINLYTGSQNPGEIAPTAYPTPSETTLLSSPSTLANYDVVMFGCQGTPTQPLVTAADIANLTSFTSNGGRVFATHYEYFLLQQSPFSQTSSFQGGGAANGLLTATINTNATFPEGETLASWIDYIGADYNGQFGQIQLNAVAQNVLGTSSTLTQVWANLNSNNRVMQFTFDTPIGTTGAPTVVLSYTNVSSSFFQGDTSDTVTVNVTNNSSADADDSLTLSITLPQGVTANSIQGGAGTGWACSISTLVCTRQASGQPLTAGSSDPVTVNFSIDPNAPVGQQSIVGTLNGGGLSGSSQCGRVLFNDYHVEGASVAKNTVYPNQCSNLPNSTVDQVKFLEFSLYNLSNFVAPTTTDLIEIQGPVALAWPPANNTIYYGTPLDGTILAAIATDSANGNPVSGTLVYTTSTGLTLTQGQILDAGTYSITATFTPTDPVGYTTPAPITNYMLTVLPDPTTASINANPASTPAGQSVTLTASLTDAYYTIVGKVTFYDGTAVLGVASVDPNSQTAVYTINTFSLGSHEIHACLNASIDYVVSCSGLAPESITLPPTITPTVTLVTSGLNPSVAGQSVTFTANVAATGPFTNYPTGTVTFLDGTTTLGTATLANGAATFTTASLAVGSHTITASYVGTASIAASVSPALTQIVNTSLGSAGSGFIMTITPTMFTVGAGSSITLGITVVELNNFNTPVTLTCSGLPSESTCAFGNATIPAGGGSTTLQVQAAAPHTCGANSSYFTAQGESRGIQIFALVTFVFFARRRRALKGLLLAVAICVLPMITGCGTCTDLGVKPGAYSFTVTGSANTGSSMPVTVTVPGETVNGGVVTQTQAMVMNVAI